MHYKPGWCESTRDCRDPGDGCALLRKPAIGYRAITWPANGFSYSYTECREGELCTIMVHSRTELRIRDIACQRQGPGNDNRPECIILYKREFEYTLLYT